MNCLLEVSAPRGRHTARRCVPAIFHGTAWKFTTEGWRTWFKDKANTPVLFRDRCEGACEIIRVRLQLQNRLKSVRSKEHLPVRRPWVLTQDLLFE